MNVEYTSISINQKSEQKAMELLGYPPYFKKENLPEPALSGFNMFMAGIKFIEERKTMNTEPTPLSIEQLAEQYADKYFDKCNMSIKMNEQFVFYQVRNAFISGAKAMQGSGMRWVKASERLPEIGGYYFVKCGIDKVLWTRSRLVARTNMLIKEAMEVQLEWLDESTQSLQASTPTVNND